MDVHVRFLVALPLLIVAELVVHQRMRFVVRQILEHELIPASATRQFEAAIASGFRLRNSVLQLSRIDLSPIPTHPDRVRGLGFLSNTAYAFMPLAAAHGAMLAGLIASRIFYVGAGLLDFKIEVAVLLLLSLSLVFGPLMVFDLGNSFVRTIRTAPITREAVLRLAAATLAPLALTMMSLEDLLKKLVGILL